MPSPGDAWDHPIRRWLALERDVLIVSVAMLAFSLAFQMTSRYLPEYLRILGGGPLVVGIYKSLSDLIGAGYPYPGGALSDRLGSRVSLTVFGLISTLGFGLWLIAPDLAVRFGPVHVPAWVWIVLGLFLTQAWKSLGLGATFAVVKQSVPPGRLAAGFASTETFRRMGFLLAPVIAVGLLAGTATFLVGFRAILTVAIGFAIGATLVQHVLYDPADDTVGSRWDGFASLRADLRTLPAPLKPLLVADALVRFGNGMIYAFVIFVITDLRSVGVDLFGLSLGPAAFFGVLLVIEMVVALLTMVPAAKLAESTGLKPVVAFGFLVYALFPVVLILTPADPLLFGLVFAFSGLRFAGLPAHKALIVGPARSGGGGRITGGYYTVRNLVVIPSGILGGVLYAIAPPVAFGVATVVTLIGTAVFVRYGQDSPAYT